MFSGLADFGNAWLGFMNPTSIALGLGGALLGIIVGILPGLSATLVIALLTTITIKLPANNAILVLICSYVGALYGGSRTAILLNIPGTAANAASCADGYALALRGEINDSNFDKNVAEAQQHLDEAKKIAPDRAETYYNEAILTQEFRSKRGNAVPTLKKAAEQYSSEVPQPERKPADLGGRWWTARSS